MKKSYELDCNLAQVLNIFGDKWTMLILHRIIRGKNTFKEIEENLESIPSNILSNRLKLLEERGLIYQELYNQHPPRYKYLPTESGLDFNSVFNSMIIWASNNLDKCSKDIGHKTCNGRVELGYYCKQCDKHIRQEDLLLIDKE